MDAMIFLLSGVAIGYGVRSWLNHPPMISLAGATEAGTVNGLVPRSGDVQRVMHRDSVIADDVADQGLHDVPKSPRVHPYPTLTSIDQVMRSPHVAFADHPGAPMLERHARELVEMYWSDSVWLTGLIDDASLAVVVAALEADRADA